MLKLLNSRNRYKENINKNEAYEMLSENDNAVLLDVRSPQEFEEGHMQNAINIPTYEIRKRTEKIIKDKETIIICYCTIGVRSKKAIKILRKLGYKNLYHLDGGM